MGLNAFGDRSTLGDYSGPIPLLRDTPPWRGITQPGQSGFAGSRRFQPVPV